MFVQIIEGRTSDAEALAARGRTWESTAGKGAVGFLGVTSGVTADGRAVTIVRFESEAAALANAERPEQHEWWQGTAALYDGEVSFTGSNDVTEWMGGGSDEARFVQVMKSTGVDRAQLERVDAAMEPHGSARPDLLGGIRIWTGPDRCVDVAYFTSEAEARQGEQAEMPEELQALMAEMGSAMGDTEYLDLVDPHLA